MKLARQDSFDDINDRVVYKSRHDISADRKARQMRQQQFQIEQSQQLDDEKTQ